jgi:hypothetical protein
MIRLCIGATILSLALVSSVRTLQSTEPNGSSPKQQAPAPEQRVPDKQQPEKPEAQEQRRSVQETPKPQPPSAKQSQRPQPQQARPGARITPQQFRTSFGPQHTFKVPQLMNGNRFQAGGFLFEIVEVWPTFWSFDDLFFVDEVDEQFFLFDVNHPGTRILVVFVE